MILNNFKKALYISNFEQNHYKQKIIGAAIKKELAAWLGAIFAN
jgi:hypothetical protein